MGGYNLGSDEALGEVTIRPSLRCEPKRRAFQQVQLGGLEKVVSNYIERTHNSDIITTFRASTTDEILRALKIRSKAYMGQFDERFKDPIPGYKFSEEDYKAEIFHIRNAINEIVGTASLFYPQISDLPEVHPSVDSSLLSPELYLLPTDRVFLSADSEISDDERQRYIRDNLSVSTDLRRRAEGARFAVLPNCRGFGFGKELVKTIYSHAFINENIDAIHITCDVKFLRFYLCNGLKKNIPLDNSRGYLMDFLCSIENGMDVSKSLNQDNLGLPYPLKGYKIEKYHREELPNSSVALVIPTKLKFP